MKQLMLFLKQNSKTTIWRYYAFTFLKDCTLFSAVLIPFYTQWGHVSLWQAQLLQSWFMLWIFILEVPTGAVADYLGRKVSLVLGSLIVAIAVLVYGSTPSFAMFLLGEFLFALGRALTSGADQALLYDALQEAGREDEVKKIFGKAHAFELGGIFVGALLGSVLAAYFELNVPLLLTAIPMLLAAGLAWSIPEPKLRKHLVEKSAYLTIVKKGFFFMYRHPSLRKLAFDGVLVAAGAYFVIWLYQPLLTTLHVPIIYFGVFQAALVATEIVIASNFTRLEKLFGSSKRLLTFSALITGVLFIVTAIVPNIFTVTLFILFAGGFGLTRLELMYAYMQRFIDSQHRATVLSSVSMMRTILLVFLNPVVGFVEDHSLRLALLFVGILPLVVFFFSPIEKHMLEQDEVKSK